MDGAILGSIEIAFAKATTSISTVQARTCGSSESQAVARRHGIFQPVDAFLAGS
jgi:uncharacterized protein GlcG (DUF336 family)